MPNHTYTRGQQVTITATVEALDNTGAPYGGRSLVPFESIGVVRPADTGGDREQLVTALADAGIGDPGLRDHITERLLAAGWTKAGDTDE